MRTVWQDHEVQGAPPPPEEGGGKALNRFGSELNFKSRSASSFAQTPLLGFRLSQLARLIPGPVGLGFGTGTSGGAMALACHDHVSG